MEIEYPKGQIVISVTPKEFMEVATGIKDRLTLQDIGPNDDRKLVILFLKEEESGTPSKDEKAIKLLTGEAGSKSPDGETASRVGEQVVRKGGREKSRMSRRGEGYIKTEYFGRS